MKAHHLACRNYNCCVEKAVFSPRRRALLGAITRGVWRNHIGRFRLEVVLHTHVLAFHGFAEVYVFRRWIKSTQYFNKGLCELLDVAPLEFNVEENAIFQEYSRQGGKFMEYLHDYGRFEDIP